MRLYKLTRPQYATDQEYARRNAVTVAESYWIPGINCEVCGPWATIRRLRVPLPPLADEFSEVRFLPVADWHKARDGWATRLGVEPAFVKPGMGIGMPSGTCKAPITEDVVHPLPGLIWVAQPVRDALTAAGVTGVSFAPVQLSPECGKVGFWELVVHGRAWRPASNWRPVVTEEGLRLCDICGRLGFPSPDFLAVDEARWDGSDFLNLDLNPNIVVVTERAAEVFTANGFSNVALEPTR